VRRPTLLGLVVLSLACAKPVSDDGQADATSGVTTGESGSGGDGDGDAGPPK
jgi:hypothetical protein